MNSMLLALQITALGMGLVFAAIILLWGMMSLLTAITADKEHSTSPDAGAPEPTKPTPVIDSGLKAQAAAVAVAIALAEQQLSIARPFAEPPTADVSPWQMGMRTRQLYQKGPIRGPRKVG